MITDRRRLATAITAAAFALTLLAQPAQAGEAPPTKSADFQGRTIDLASGWGTATACTTDGVATHCFETEAEMDEYVGTQAALLSDCGSSLRLYSDADYGGSVLSLTVGGIWLELAGYGFDGVTSSYSIGACNSYLADGEGGGGDWYPGATSAGASSAGMLAGWDDLLSSVYIA
jgi:hypothetical protein